MSITCTTQAADSPRLNKNILIISWDGVQREHMLELLVQGKLPNLKALGEEGSFVWLQITTHKTDTKAGHTQILTGYTPEVTGVYNNAKYGAIPEGLSLFERFENYFGKDNVATIALTGKSHHIGSLPAGLRSDRKRLPPTPHPAEPWNLVKAHLDVWDGDQQRDADVVGDKALQYLKNFADRPFFFFLHFSDPDHNGHRSGENSNEYANGIILCDEWLGRVRKQLETLGIADRTLIYVTTDHGFDEGKPMHANAPHTWLVTNDNLTAQYGDQMDIAPTILKRVGIDPDGFNPPLPGKPLF